MMRKYDKNEGEFVRCARYKGFTAKSFNMYDKILIPVKDNVHWLLIVVDNKEKKIYVCDSFNKTKNFWATDILKHFTKYQQYGDYTVDTIRSPQQENGYDCGAFVLENARRILFNDGKLDYKQSDIPACRKRMLEEIKNNKLDL